MADEQDLEALHSGDLDLARRDFRDANLSHLDLRGRDFTGAHLERAIAKGALFSRAILSNAHMTGVVAEEADFSEVKAEGTVFVNVNFRGARFDKAKLNRSHFSNANLRGASMLGAELKRAHLNEGSNFSDCTTDATTLFDGATIFRPLARENAFRFYRVERGQLVRSERAESSATFEAREPAPSATNPAQQSPPRFDSPEGYFELDYRRFDGRIFIGSGAWEFETHWTTAGNGSIYTTSDGQSVASVAVAPGVHTISDVTSDVFARADFTSRVRSPRNGEVVLLRNRNGYAAAIEIVEVTLTRESQPGTKLLARYRILTDKSSDFSGRRGPSALQILRRAAGSALEALEGVAPSDEDSSGVIGIGHNGPPADAALTREDYVELSTTLVELRDAASEPDRRRLENAKTRLVDAGKKIVAWARAKLAQVEEGFFTQLGATLADPQRLVILWLAVSGSLSEVIGAVVKLLVGG